MLLSLQSSRRPGAAYPTTIHDNLLPLLPFTFPVICAVIRRDCILGCWPVQSLPANCLFNTLDNLIWECSITGPYHITLAVHVEPTLVSGVMRLLRICQNDFENKCWNARTLILMGVHIAVQSGLTFFLHVCPVCIT